MKYIDLSSTIAPSPEGVPAYLRTEIVYHSHADGAAQAQSILKVPASVFRNEEGWATETITQLGTHGSTHIDAPWHYNSEIQGKRAATVDELPLEWFYQAGVVLDMTHKADGDAMTVADAQQALERIGHCLKPLDIVMVRTGCDAYYDQRSYFSRGCGVTSEATRWLFDQGVRVMGIDACGWDPPLLGQAKAAMATGQSGVFWAAHQANLPYAQIERLVNLAQLPAVGFMVACFPLKIKGGSAGPARVVAMVP